MSTVFQLTMQKIDVLINEIQYYTAVEVDEMQLCLSTWMTIKETMLSIYTVCFCISEVQKQVKLDDFF